MWIRFIVDWVQIFARNWTPTGILLVVLEFVYSVTDPPIKALRRVIPPLRIGTVALDLSFIIVMIVAYMRLYRRWLPLAKAGSRSNLPVRSTCHISPMTGATVPKKTFRLDDIPDARGRR